MKDCIALYVFAMLLLCSSLLAAQTQTVRDSLWIVWENETLADSVRLNAIHTLAFNEYATINPDSARLLARIELDYARSVESGLWEGRALNTIAVSFQIQNQPDSVKYYILEAIELFEKLKMNQGLMYGYGNLSEYYRSQSEFQEAIEYGSKSLEIAKDLQRMDVVAQLLANLGGVYLQTGDYQNAIDKFNKAISIAEKFDYVSMLPNAYTGLGIVHGELGHNEEAIESFEKSIFYCKKTNNVYQQINPLNNIGEIHLRMGDSEKAIGFYQQSLEISEKIDAQQGISMTTNALSSIYMHQEKYKLASDYLGRSIKISTETADKPNLISALNNRTELELKLGQYAKALGTAKKSLELAKESGILVGNRDAAKSLYAVYKAMGRYKEALEVNELFVTLKDSIDKKENSDEVFRQKYKYQYEKQALADSLTQNEAKLKLELAHQEEIASKNQTRILLVGAAVLVLLLAGGAWRRSVFIKKANKQLAIEKQKAQEGEAFKQSFLANMSHEIRTPMNAILGMTNLTLDTQLSDKQKNYLDAVKQSSESLLVIINDILDISKLEASGLILESIPFKLKEVVEQVKTTLQFKAEEKSLALNIEMPDDLPEYVVGDPTRLGQILMNLCGNAIKFTEKGSVSLELKKTANGIRFSVKDTGVGIPKEQQAKLFDSFQQADASTTRKYGGTGLGLSIAKSFVDLMGGELALSSEEGKGSTFFFTIALPAADSDMVKVMASTKAMDYSQLKGLRILLAEDNKFNQIVVVDTLLNLVEDVKVDVAINGKEALEMHQRDTYDIILMDSDMPEMDGRQATKAIRKLNAPQKDIPIIALTASVLASEIDKCLEAGMNDSIPKPFKREEFFAIIGKYYSA